MKLKPLQSHQRLHLCLGSDKGVLLAALTSSGAPNVKQQIIFGALAMDSDIPQVRISM